MLRYREAQDGQLLEEGITEAGALSSWVGGGNGVQRARRRDAAVLHLLLDVRLPARRRPDLGGGRPARRAASCSARPRAARRSAAKACSTRTAAATSWPPTVPNCRAYDPAFAYELAVILDHGTRRMMERQDDVFYYVTVMNENYAQPSLPARRCGRHRSRHVPAVGRRRPARGRRSGCSARGAILREVIAAAALLRDDWQVTSEVWSVTSFSELAREAREVERCEPAASGVDGRARATSSAASPATAPIVAATDYVRAYPQLIASYVGAPFVALGHRRLRPQRYARRAARLLRERSPARRRCDAARTVTAGIPPRCNRRRRRRTLRDRRRRGRSLDALTMTMRDNPVKATLAAGGRAFGAMVFEFFTPGMPQICANAGAEFALFDMEHTGPRLRDAEDAVRAVPRACRIVPMARVPRSEYHFIARALDVGALGVMVPMVGTADEAAHIVVVRALSAAGAARRGVRLRPRRLPGRQRRRKDRGAPCAHAADRADRDGRGPTQRRGDRRGARHRRAVARPFRPDQFDGHSGRRSTIRTMWRRSRGSSPRAKQAGKVAAFLATDERSARDAVARGFRMFAYGIDQLMLQEALRAGLSMLREIRR